MGSRKGNKFSVMLGVENTSKTDGRAVVQLYASKYKPVTQREPVRLIGFAKPLIKAGNVSEVKISFDKQELAYFDEEHNKFLVEGGKYELFVSLLGCEDLIPAGEIYIADGSEELKCGPSWRLDRIAEHKELTDALVKDCEALGIPFMAFTVNLQYVPSMKLCELFKDTSGFKSFNKAAGEYRPD